MKNDEEQFQIPNFSDLVNIDFHSDFADIDEYAKQ